VPAKREDIREDKMVRLALLHSGEKFCTLNNIIGKRDRVNLYNPIIFLKIILTPFLFFPALGMPAKLNWILKISFEDRK
jgi:hypothetical protein